MDIVRVNKEKELSFVGIGMGGLGQITLEGIEALLCSDAWMGAFRMIESGKEICRHIQHTRRFFEPQNSIPLEDKQILVAYRPEEILDWLINHSQTERPAVLYSGDVGFYSGAKDMAKQINERHLPYTCRMIPGISSLSYFAAKIGRSWDKVKTASFHGREEAIDWSLPDGKEWFLLLDGSARLHQICRLLMDHGQKEAKLWVGEWFSYPKERIICATPGEMLDMEFDSLSAAWIVPQG